MRSRPWFAPTLIILLVGLLVFTVFRGVFFPDEGYILNSAARILDGQIPYRDFDFVYTPFTPYAAGLAFVLFGKSVFAARLLHLLLTLMISWYIYTTARSLTKNQIIPIIPCSLYLAWGPTHLNYLNPSMYAVNFAILAVMSFLTGNLHHSSRAGYISAGALILAMLSKQNFGVAAALTILLGVILLRKRLHALFLKPFLRGLLLSAAVVLGYFLISGSLQPFYRNMYDHVYQLMVLKGSLNTPLHFDQNLFSFGKLIYYTLPLTLSLWAILQAVRAKSPLVLLPVFSLLVYLIGIRPETDYIHLIPLLALTGFPLFTLLLTVKRTWVQRALLTITTMLFLLGVWSALFFPYYRFEPPLISQNHYVDHPRVGIWTDTQSADEIMRVQTLIQDSTQPGEAVFLEYYAPMVYFLTDRQNPTRYDYVGLGAEYQQDLIQTLEQKKVPTIIRYYLGNNNAGPVAAYVKSHYVKLKTIGEYEIWIRKAS